MTSRIRFVACLIGVAAFLWVSFSFVVALPLPHEAETGTVLRSALRLNLLMAGGILAICLLGLRVLEKNFHRGAFAHSAGTAAFLGVSIAVAAQVDSNSLLVSVLKGVGIALALVVASVAIARLVPMKRSPQLD